MASVQWGATNSAFLTFIASASLRNLPAGAGTIAIIWKPVQPTEGCDGVAMTNTAAAASTFYHSISMHVNGTQAWGDDCQAGAWVASTSAYTALTAGHWYVTVVGWAGGAAAKDRWHWFDLSMSAPADTWHHEDSDINNAGALSAPSSAWFRAGWSNDFTIGSGQQIALIAAWVGTNLSDANVAALTTNRQTSDWYNNAGGTPAFLSEITSLTPTDLGSGSSAFSGANSVVTDLTVGGDPAGGWNFDGVGAPTADPATIRTLTSPRLV